MNYKTPIQHLFDNIYIKRDDLLPLSFGGNKLRIAYEFLNDMKEKRCNCLVGYGNARSNLCRVLSCLCSNEKIPCYIISPSDDDGMVPDTFNSRLSNLSGAFYVKCSKDAVAETIERLLNRLSSSGLKPYYINGDVFGKGNEVTPLRAYAGVYKEIVEQDDFDFIFVPTGTGMTQAGLLLGMHEFRGDGTVVGISIARSAKNETEVIKRFLKLAGVPESLIENKVIVCDDYLMGGYAKRDFEVDELILSIYNNYGIPLDPTYTGKAFYGMLDYIKKNRLGNKKCLFIHTGGTPLFFDFLKDNRVNYDLRRNVSFEKLVTFLREIDAELIVPLSKRVNLEAFASKVVSCGQTVSVVEAGRVVSSVMFYCNDEVNKTGYITLLGTLPEYGGKGMGRQLIESALAIQKQCGMKCCKLETDFSNNKAISLYLKMGFTIEFVDEKIHMKKEL